MTPGSAHYKKICKNFKDSQILMPEHSPYQTWFARYPIRRIDYIFVSEEFHVERIELPHTALDRVASDHLPLVVQLGLSQKVNSLQTPASKKAGE